MTPAELIERFPGLRVAVIGEAMLDSYVAGSVSRLCREAPVPIVAVDRSVDVLGGAANTACGMRALGAAVEFISVVGADDAGAKVLGHLEQHGIDGSACLRAPQRATLVKQRVTGNGQLLLRLDTGSEGEVDELLQRRLGEAVTAAWERCDAFVISDYGYGIVTDAIVRTIAALQARSPRVLVADGKDLTRFRAVGVTAAKPNYEETTRLAKLHPTDGTQARVEQVTAARAALEAATGAEILTVTLDRSGSIVFERGREPYRTFTTPAADSHAAGAGDTFTGTLALALAAGAHAAGAADLASAAATAVLATPGTSTCTAAMLAEQVAGERKVENPAQVAAAVDAWRGAGKRIVFTNGCFDILHHGHISYLNRAKAMGDVLIVGLNSDASVRALKGPTRPINAEGDRAAVLAALSCVDLVVLFDEATPARLIETLRPDLFVKGGDYTIETLPEAPLVLSLGGEVKLLPFLDDRSTTGIIERIRAAYGTQEAAG